ncbi:MAG: nuclear transport factor 2 family protein [Lentimicrobium sp.]|nr:nuclear transport factor 2 family protein [Lentimicrobium sp.]
MKNLTAALLLFFVAFCARIVIAQENADEAMIKEVINKAYIEGIQNQGNIEDIRNGFHPGFDLLMMRNNSLSKLPIYTWLETIERRKAENPSGPAAKTSVKFLMIDITGNAAVAKIELHREEKLIFTDYLSLYRFEEGWKIVSKIYYQH